MAPSSGNAIFPASAAASRRDRCEDRMAIRDGSRPQSFGCETPPLACRRLWRRSARKLRHEASRQEGSIELQVREVKFLRRSLKRHDHTETVVTDRVPSYGSALKQPGAIDPRKIGRWLNNHAENSRKPFRRRERAMLRFRQMRSLQNFAALYGSIHNHFSQERTLIRRRNFKDRRTAALTAWQQLCAA
jgi:hypothetical protein